MKQNKEYFAFLKSRIEAVIHKKKYVRHLFFIYLYFQLIKNC